MEVCAILTNGTLEREVTVTLRTGDGTATSGGMYTLNYVVSNYYMYRVFIATLLYFYLKRAYSDYVAVTVDLVFDANTSRSCVSVTTTEDDIYEDSEVFDVTLEAADTGVTVAPDEGEITITDEDGAKIVFFTLHIN